MTTATGRERPWRATAFVPDPTGQTLAGRKREVAGRAAAKTKAGLARFTTEHEDLGHVVDVVEVLSFDYDHDHQEDCSPDPERPGWSTWPGKADGAPHPRGTSEDAARRLPGGRS